MKKNYIAPSMEVELFELDASIAGNCLLVVDNGPAIPGYRNEACSKYVDPFATTYSTRSNAVNVDFYDDVVCTCYTTGSGNGYWTS